MKRTFSTNTIIIAGCVSFFSISVPVVGYAISLPAGFEDIYNQKNSGIFEITQRNHSLGSVTVKYDREQVWLSTVGALVDQLYDPDMPRLSISRDTLMSELSLPLKRVSKAGYDGNAINARIDESTAVIELVFPESYFITQASATDSPLIVYKSHPGYVHSHNLSYLSDNFNDSFAFTSVDTLGLTGNSYINGVWNYTDGYNFTLDELALNIEQQKIHYKLGRQRMSDSLLNSTPSVSYSFFSPVSIDGVSLGYSPEHYVYRNSGAASPVTVYFPDSGTVEIYRSGRLIDMQQFPAGIHHLDTETWPAGGYTIELIVKLANGTQQRKSQPFYKRTGTFRSGDIEYLIQLGRYDERQGQFRSSRYSDDFSRVDGNMMGSALFGYTTQSATSVGSGLLVDDSHYYFSGSLDMPVDTWLAERFYSDGLLGEHGSYAWMAGINKNFGHYGFDLNYRTNRYKGPETFYHRVGIVSAYDYDTWQMNASTLLPWGVGLSVSYGLETLYHSWGRQNRSRYENWDVNLSKDFLLSELVNLRMDLGYHQGNNDYRYDNASVSSQSFTRDRRVYAQLTLSARERSYNHYQSFFLRSRMTDSDSEGDSYSGDYNLDIYNPEFDRSGKYSMRAGITKNNNGQKIATAGMTVDNNLGYTSASISKDFGHNGYTQKYLAQRSGFAIGDGQTSFGKLDTVSALIVDATDLPQGQYFEVRNKTGTPTVVEGGSKTTLSLQPHQKIAPVVDQVYTGDQQEFYTFKTRTTSTWIMPGQVYTVKVEGKKNQTVTGRIYFDGRPLGSARVVGGNTVTDEEGLFVGDFSLAVNDKISELSVIHDEVSYVCPLQEENIKLTHGVMQIREVNCEIK
jgi:hypothetical protein